MLHQKLIQIKKTIRWNKPNTIRVCSSIGGFNLRFFFISLTFLIIISSQLSYSQIIRPDSAKLAEVVKKYIEFDNYTFLRTIKTVNLTNPDWQLSYPVLRLNSGQKLQLTFDDLAEESENYQYVIYHMNMDWTAKDASFMEYASGFEINEITDYESSYSAITPYHHYKLEIPNDDIQLNISGNYIIEVFKDDIEKPILRRRFVLYESKVEIEGDVIRAMTKNQGATSHKIPFTIDLNGMLVNDPYTEIIVNIVPNNNWNKMHDGFQPLYIRGDQLIFKDREENIFEAGNEYRTINIKDLSYQAEMVSSIQRINYDYHVKLKNDASRRYIRYIKHQDLNGHFFIEKSNSMTPDLDADYVYVYFTLDVEIPILSGNIFVYGGLSDYTFGSHNVMSYNAPQKRYELIMLLKQGFYDYQYVVLDSYLNNKPNFATVEGNHWQTQNDYLVYVYLLDLANGYHRVVGFRNLRTEF
jgi:hypothetical protein